MSRIGLVHSGHPPSFLDRLPAPITSVALSLSTDPKDWIGRLEQQNDGSWHLTAADLSIDKLTGKTHLRSRSLTDRLMELARREGWTGIHHYGVTDPNPLVCAVAAAELELPFLLSFAEGEAESVLFDKPADLRAALRAATAFTTPSQNEANLIHRFLGGGRVSVVVPSTFSLPARIQNLPSTETIHWDAVPRPLLGCWGRHGRASGLSTLLELARELSASLLLVGPFEASEMYDWSPRIDHHENSERIFRVGKRSPESAAALLHCCDLALFPMTVSNQAHYALSALAGGAKVVSSRVGVLAEVEGLATVLVGGDWANAVRQQLSAWTGPVKNWQSAFSAEVVGTRWKEAYRTGGLCT